MQNKAYVPLIAAVLLFLGVTNADAFRRLSEGGRIPDSTLETIDGKHLALGDNLGEKATIVLFWAAWSPRSHEAIADMEKLAGEYALKGLKIIAVNGEHQEWDPSELKIIRQTAETGRSLLHLLDKNLTLFDLVGVTAVPSAALLDQDGKIIKLLPGYSAMGRNEFRDEAAARLDNRPGVEAQAKPPSLGAPGGKAARRYQMAVILAKKGQRERAAAALREALDEDPGYKEAALLLADLTGKAEKQDEAMQNAK